MDDTNGNSPIPDGPGWGVSLSYAFSRGNTRELGGGSGEFPPADGGRMFRLRATYFLHREGRFRPYMPTAADSCTVKGAHLSAQLVLLLLWQLVTSGARNADRSAYPAPAASTMLTGRRSGDRGRSPGELWVLSFAGKCLARRRNSPSRRRTVLVISDLSAPAVIRGDMVQLSRAV